MFTFLFLLTGIAGVSTVLNQWLNRGGDVGATYSVQERQRMANLRAFQHDH